MKLKSWKKYSRKNENHSVAFIWIWKTGNTQNRYDVVFILKYYSRRKMGNKIKANAMLAVQDTDVQRKVSVELVREKFLGEKIANGEKIRKQRADRRQKSRQWRVKIFYVSGVRKSMVCTFSIV